MTRSGSHDIESDTQPAALQPVLSILVVRANYKASTDRWIIEGDMQNLSAQPLTNLQVFSTWFDPGGASVTTDHGLVDLQQIRPGEVSTFRTITKARGNLSRFEIAFQSELGQPIVTRDDSDRTAHALPFPLHGNGGDMAPD